MQGPTLGANQIKSPHNIPLTLMGNKTVSVLKQSAQKKTLNNNVFVLHLPTLSATQVKSLHSIFLNLIDNNNFLTLCHKLLRKVK